MSSYILVIGFRQRLFKTRIMTDICFNSSIDTMDINQTIKTMKKQQLISKEGKQSQNNILRESGKKIARELLVQICSE